MFGFFDKNQFTLWQPLLQQLGVWMEQGVLFSVDQQDGVMDPVQLSCTVIMQAVLIILFSVFSVCFFSIGKQ
ncbi:hypothetical protein D3C75_1101430 [compost metagenome]